MENTKIKLKWPLVNELQQMKVRPKNLFGNTKADPFVPTVFLSFLLNFELWITCIFVLQISNIEAFG